MFSPARLEVPLNTQSIGKSPHKGIALVLSLQYKGYPGPSQQSLKDKTQKEKPASKKPNYVPDQSPKIFKGKLQKFVPKNIKFLMSMI